MARFGQLVGTVIAAAAEQTDKHGPVLERFDRYGVEVDHVVHHPTLDRLQGRPRAPRVHEPRDLCRASRAGRRHGVPGVPGVPGRDGPVLRARDDGRRGRRGGALRAAGGARRLVDRLRSSDPDVAWEGGMFMTERQGGSDVGANTTRAVQDGDEWLLFGEKHFCSNVDAEVFIVLARPDGAPAGSRGLATFIVPRLLPNGIAERVPIKRLKPKLGTVGVPTAEVDLDGARAWLAGGASQRRRTTSRQATTRGVATAGA